MAKDLQLATGAPMPLCGNAVLAASALSSQAHADVEIDGRRFPLSIYLLVIAESGERKSTVDRFALAPHRSLEESRWKDYHLRKPGNDMDVALFEASMNAILKNRKLSDEEKALQLKALTPPVRLRRPHLIIEDATVQALLQVAPGSGPHAYRLLCESCGAFLKWLPKRRQP
jgi:hypothetical protein